MFMKRKLIALFVSAVIAAGFSSCVVRPHHHHFHHYDAYHDHG